MQKFQHTAASKQLKTDLAKRFFKPKGRIDAQLLKFTDLSGGCYYVPSKAQLYKLLDKAFRLSDKAEACLAELAPTDVRVFYVDIDMHVLPGSPFLDPAIFVDILNKCIMPGLRKYFNAVTEEQWGALRFGILVPNAVRDGKKKGTKKFGCHIQVLQLHNECGDDPTSLFIHREQAIVVYRSIERLLRTHWPEQKFGVDWAEALDRAPLKNGGMRLAYHRKWKMPCPCKHEEGCLRCKYMGVLHDKSYYVPYKVFSGNRVEDTETCDKMEANKRFAWAVTSIGCRLKSQKDADVANGFEFSMPDGSYPALQTEVNALQTYHSTTENGWQIPHTSPTKRRKRLPCEKQIDRMTSSKVGAVAIDLEERYRKQLQQYIHQYFPHYENGIRVGQVFRLTNVTVTIYRVALEGENAGKCLNRKEKGSHTARTYIELREQGACQRCWSSNSGATECKRNSEGKVVPCNRFRSHRNQFLIGLTPPLRARLFPTKTQNDDTNCPNLTVRPTSVLHQNFLAMFQ